MAYATQTDIENRLTAKKLIELTDFDGSGEINAMRVTDALAAASSEIDSYAGGRYTLPLAPSAQVKDICLRLVIYRLYTLRQRPMPETVLADRVDAMKLLADVAAARATLDQPSAVQATGMAAQTADHAVSPEVFDENKFYNF